ncbi:unnamed protein product, partial [Ectocarpus sp. 13 AM-2016]
GFGNLRGNCGKQRATCPRCSATRRYVEGTPMVDATPADLFLSRAKDVPLGVCHRGWVFVAWQRRCKTSRSLRELGNQVTAFLLVSGFICCGGRVDYVVRGRDPSLRAKGMITPR